MININKISISLILVLSISKLSLADNIKFKDIVDLNKKHWAYTSCLNTIEKYKIMSPYSDHTFRGKQTINRYQFFSVILKTIKYLENSKNISIRNNNTDIIKFDDLNNTHWSYKSVEELVNNYNIRLIDMNTEFNGDFEITRFEAAYTIYDLIKKIKNIKDDIKDDIYEKYSENIINLNIMSLYKDNEFNGNNSINRYELSVIINKLVEFVEKN